MKQLVLLLTLVFAIGILEAQEIYRFHTNAPQGFSIESSTDSGLLLHYTINKISIAEINNDEVKGQEIVLKGSFGSFAEGRPNLPVENRYIAVPQGASVSIEVKEKGNQTLHDINLLPAAAVQGNTAVGLPKLHKDMSIFGKDADFPNENVTIAQTTRIRGLDVILLSVTPFRYNPVRKTLDVIYDMDIAIRFEGGNGTFGETRYRNPDWDNILRNLVLNSDMFPDAHYYERLNEVMQNRENGCEYLIITPDDDSLTAWADTLKAFRNKQGILTKVVTTTECGGNEAETIKGYIKNAYDNWAIPPAAVLIFNGLTDTMASSWPPPEQYVGGTQGIPGFPLLFLNYNDEGVNHSYKSDSPYADMNDDSIPDIALSRLPVTTPEEYRKQVQRLIQYETHPPIEPQYYDRPVISSGYEFNKWFLITSQSANGFFRNKLGKHPYNFYMLYQYTQNGSLPDSAWSTGYNTATVVDYFGPDGQNYFPRYPNALDDWRDMEDNSYFTEALNSNTFMTLYRDHSAVDWWCCPVFEYNEIANLTNTEPTFILSIGCHTAKYTDTYYTGAYTGGFFRAPSMLNTFCRNNVGAIGSIGAVTVTHSQYNDILTWGFLDYIWPEFMPDLGNATVPEFVRPSFGLVASKLFLNQQAFLPDWWPTKILTTNNVFHYIGEAYMNLYTEVPQPLTLEAPLQHPNAQWHYRYTAEEGATVCFSKDGEILYVVPASGEPQTVELPQMAVGEQFTITATKQNCFRLEQDVTVIHSGFDAPEQKTVNFEIHPNPTHGEVTLTINERLQDKGIIEVYNLLGERMHYHNISQLSPNESLHLDLSMMPSGLYFIKLSTERGYCCKKVVVN